VDFRSLVRRPYDIEIIFFPLKGGEQRISLLNNCGLHRVVRRFAEGILNIEETNQVRKSK